MKKHILNLVMHSPEGRETVLSYVGEPEDVAQVREKIRALVAPFYERIGASATNKAGRKATPVVVMEIEDKVHEAWVEKGAGDMREREHGAFLSAGEASAFLGCSFNEVGTALAAAQRRGETQATVRGVTFSKIDEASLGN